ncbi:MAG: SUMF1/EgtB/PvdO family nonheme iron enzyme [Planctomycetaceae bacterium]|nr:SUMF1/EgtB/PvdO family nonheme iron enzyme [Planctomycetaceae bacterium]
MLRIFISLLFCLVPFAAFAFDNGRTPVNTPESAKRMIEDLIQNFGNKYPKGKEYLQRVNDLAGKLKEPDKNPDARKEFDALLREAALANPLLDFDKILVVRRDKKRGFGFIGLNSHTNENMPRNGFDNELAVLSHLRTAPKLTPFYRHLDFGSPIRDPDLHFDGQRIMFSAIEKANYNGKDELRWAVYEVGIDGQNLKKLTPFIHDVDWFDSCYLPEEGAFITASTAGMQGLPCENGGRPMVNLYRVDLAKDGGEPKIRQLTFEQDSDWHPTVMSDGRVMYLRWEYSDIPHYTSRMLFAMQPDGRQQRALWGSGSLFPTAYRNPRQIPGHSSMVLGVLSGHHVAYGGMPETGRLMLLNPQYASKYPFRFDPASKEWGPEGNHINVFPRVFPKEETGCVQEIPGYGKDVVGNIYDNQGGIGTYRFVYPYPLHENYYLVSMKRYDKPTFGLYLADRFDNLTQILEMPEHSLFFATPLMPRPRPPVKPDITEPDNMTGSMFITDIYHGEGLKGVPRGTVKSLRIFAYHFGFRRSGGHESVGQNASWDIKRILGTVPVEEDGSASFNVPANTPISIQALDADGRAVQLMRSWTVCMPGEQQSCVGCHELPNEVTPTKAVAASKRPPSEIKPWYGQARSFGYEAEIQPMLEKHCVSCHNDATQKDRKMISFEARNTGKWQTDTSYAALNPYVWRPGPEPDMAVLPPGDYHASVSELIQRLQKGHYGVQLDKEAWDRLYTWIDLNVPYRGQWSNPPYETRRLELSKLYANLDTNPEEEYRSALKSRQQIETPKLSPEQLDEVVQKFTAKDHLTLRSFPFDTETAVRMQRPSAEESFRMTVSIGSPPAPTAKTGLPADTSAAWKPGDDLNGRTAAPLSEKVSLNDNTKITFVRIPAGEYIMGQLDGLPDEQKRKIVKIEKPFWIAESEITNGQYGVFDPEHDTRYLHEDGKDHVVPGYIANHPDQPVARISFQEAEAFCRWLSEKLRDSKAGNVNAPVTAKLPTEAEWEWAARAGTDTPFWYGDRNTDFSKYANLAGAEVQKTATTWERGATLHIRRDYDLKQIYPLRDNRFSDKWFVVDYAKQYEPNPWGLYDMIGNVWEWTYPEPDSAAAGKVVARGGSWKDRPQFSGSSTRVIYEPWQKVMNVGFRPILTE